MSNAILVKADGTETAVTPRDGNSFQLDEMQGFVGGHIEIIELADGRLMILNEEGKLNGLPINGRACELTEGAGLQFGDLIVGDVLVTPPKFIE